MPKKRWRRLKGQATIFVVLGLVLVAVFAFALYARSLLTTDRAQQEAERILTDVIQTNSINYYVENCLEDVSADAIRHAAARGGLSSDHEGDPWQDHFLYNDTGQVYEVAYAIKPNDRCDEVSLDPPPYPRPRTELEDLYGIYEGSSCKSDRLSGFLGKAALPKLCYLKGANAFRETPGHSALACKTNAYTLRDDNIQNDLQRNITEGLKTCADFSLYEDILGHNITVHEDEANTTVIYGQDKVHVTATYPFTVRVSDGQTVVAMREFSYTSPYRLKQVYEYLINLVKNDNKRYDFNLTESYDDVDGYDPSFDVTVIQDPCADHEDCPENGPLYDDVIRLEDRREDARVDNRTLVFHAAIRNRRPALDYIHETGNSDYDLQAREDDTLWLTPEGYDPDDRGVSYHYKGWKETWDAQYNFECAASCTTTECLRTECVDVDESVEPHNWTESQPYIDTKQDAKINLTRNDTGLHNVTITVRDDTGLEDFQVVRILVYDLPVARPNGTNMIPGISDEYASLEDPYLLNGSESTASQVMNEPLTTWIWTGGHDGERTFTIKDNDHLYLLPGTGTFYHLQDGDLGSDDITQHPFNTTHNSLIEGLDYTVNLTVGSSNFFSDPSSFTLDVRQCLPVRNDTHPHPYPYNDTDSTSYEHACCLGDTDPEGEPDSNEWGEIALESTACFTHSETGILDDLWDVHKGLESLYNNPEIQFPNNIDDDTTYLRYSSSQIEALQNLERNFHDASEAQKEYQNDPFNLTFTRHCDGKRGNTCTGDAEEEYRQLQECDDYEEEGQDERCSGAEGQTCKYYSYSDGYPRTFEQEHKLPDIDGNTADGICNDHEQCADPMETNGYSYDNDPSDGVHLCRGGCAEEQGCVAPVECQCDIDTCGAECEPGDSTYNHPSSFSPQDLGQASCDHSCNNDDCEYKVTDEPCPPYCIHTDQNPDSYEDCAYTRTDFTEDAYCHYHQGVIDSGDFSAVCTQHGCRLPKTEELRADFCDTCTLQQGRVEGAECPAPGSMGTTNQNLNTCYYTADGDDFNQRCTSSGVCRLYTDDVEDDHEDCLDTGQTGVTCTPTGVECCDEEDDDCFEPR
ncbi:MAG: hypothetical protein ACLFO2_00445 [Candidatus Woesearchaeota archaeon]